MVDLETQFNLNKLRELGVVDETDNVTPEYRKYVMSLQKGNKRAEAILYLKELLARKIVFPTKDGTPEDVVFIAFMIKEFVSSRTILPIEITDSTLVEMAEALFKVMNTTQRWGAIMKADAKTSYNKGGTFYNAVQ